jgi:hypothetical protein
MANSPVGCVSRVGFAGDSGRWHSVTAGSSADVDTVVTAAGDVVVPSDVVRQLSLVPGQRVRLTISAAGHRRNMYGVLAGRLPGRGS